MVDAQPPSGTGPLGKREARLAWGLLTPTITAVALVVVLPLLSIFWISVKPVKLADLRPPEVVLREDLRGDPEVAGDQATIRYRLRNSSQDQPILDVKFDDVVPEGLQVQSVDERCSLDDRNLRCEFGDWQPGFRETLTFPVLVEQSYFDNGIRPQDSDAITTGRSANVLTNSTFTFDNFARIFNGDEFDPRQKSLHDD